MRKGVSKYKTEEEKLEASRAASRRFRANNLEKMRLIQKESKRRWREKNREEDRRRVREWQLKYPEKCRALKARYRHRKNRATPKWANFKDIDQVYVNCPSADHVDHIIPLNHPEVCGLHVPWNLQYLSIEENTQKSNSFDFTYDNDSWKDKK